MAAPAAPGRRRAGARIARTVRGTLRMAWDASPRGFLTLYALALLTAAMPPIAVWAGKSLVDLVARGATTGLPDRRLLPTVILLAAVIAGQRAFQALQSSRNELFSESVRLHAERRFLEKAARADLGHFDNSDWHDRMARAARDLNYRPPRLVYATISLSSSLVTLGGMLGILLSLHPTLVALAVGSVIPGLAIQRRQARKLYDFFWSNTPDEREQGYVRDLLAEPRHTKEIRAFNLRDHLIDRYWEISTGRLRRMSGLYYGFDRLLVASAAIAGVAMGVAYWFVGTRALDGELTVGALAAITGAVASVTGQITQLTYSYLDLEQHAAFLEDYFAFLALETLIPVREDPVPVGDLRVHGVEFDDVTFTYPGGTEPALSNLSLQVRPGELVALVGDNGAGKTSMVKLLLRFYDPQQGAVRVGGTDLRDTDPDELRSRIAILFQDYATYELSVRDNVTLGRAERAVDDDEIRAAIAAARADRIVKGLPHGLDSKVGRLFEGGHDLSGGEWQRLALARLIYRGADIWILDEPTSALDPEAEAAIFTELRENLRGRIGIVISHRFSTVRIADRIAVVVDGRVTELGTHEELLALDGRYAQLFELQAAGYR